MSYTAPIKDMLFNMEHIAGLEQLTQWPVWSEAGLDTAQAVLEECAKLNESVMAPLNWEGDKNPSFFQRRSGENHARVQGRLPSIHRGRLAGFATP